MKAILLNLIASATLVGSVSLAAADSAAPPSDTDAQKTAAVTATTASTEAAAPAVQAKPVVTPYKQQASVPAPVAPVHRPVVTARQQVPIFQRVAYNEHNVTIRSFPLLIGVGF